MSGRSYCDSKSNQKLLILIEPKVHGLTLTVLRCYQVTKIKILIIKIIQLLMR